MVKPTQIIYGIHPVAEALKEGKELERVFLLNDTRNKALAEIFHECREKGIPVSHVPLQKLAKLSKKNHQGVIAQLPLIGYHDFREIVTQVFEKGEIPKVLILDHITDVRNFGALARTAHVFGYHCIIVPDKGSAAINEDALKTSAGALNSIKVCKSSNLITDTELLKEYGLKIFACTEKGKQSIDEITEHNEPIALVLGSEDKGIHPAIIKAADANFFIPMTSNLDSLNVSVAGGIAMYHLISNKRQS